MDEPGFLEIIAAARAGAKNPAPGTD